ncbi:CamS family sex pheromone protein [Eremococcus coleocola]|uniref:CamS sex pheromone family protein n=1 Tax=Eremococcus coleocola ACS-139-V-Col8 TaxID=908337 RepID=E4KPN5_9LACT|nr:CamS family sex pheromone protein [Eremococcus coleocola]EFR31137.1 CamS sex pheromone family protein [Eremococcus coleocola ACS-139-V-Col8]
MRKSLKVLSLISLLSVVLSGCLNDLGNQEDREASLAPNEVSVQTTDNQISDEYYRAVITDGKYNLGISDTDNTNLLGARNMAAFEAGLMRISKSVFPTNQYYLQEGQLIDADTMTAWLSRESETNGEGLNPELPAEDIKDVESSSESTAPGDQPEGQESDESQESQATEATVVDEQIPPIYLNQIMEKDIMVESDDGFSLGGVVIGLSMNSLYQYTDSDGTEYQTEISVGEMRERGKQYANIIVGRLRNTEQLRSVPIVVGIYASTPDSENIGGTYLLDGISREGNNVSDWAEHNEYRVLLPVRDDQSQNDQYNYFTDFANDVENFFPNLNGISGDAWYIDNGLAELNIEIITQFFQETEITAISQYVNDVASRRLPEGVPIEIKISSVSGLEALLVRNANSDQFQVTILN